MENPQVFPLVIPDDPNCGFIGYTEPGMTLLDYFAGQALSGAVSNNNDHDVNVKRAYAIAKFMLKERKRILKQLEDE